ncbi:MAG: putative ubiquitin-conjugating enzyme E2 [Terrestrivirus sp.]|uniref:E2 ubiquitin-conjugating enzyme n=1 Tax=Terrestrivirus sp. TaxID=2487775 RepID=A0A3G4ZLS9_9VIRU|nr:MAG: putative ubiquitin-conjugating enzyme E2 [Terrestrivirus sp.]
MYKNSGYNTTKTSRLTHEFKLLSKMDPDECDIITENDFNDDGHSKINKIHAFVKCKNNTPYHGYKFEVMINLGELFPYKPLSINFKTDIKHININNGIISSRCINLDPRSATLKDILEEVITLIEKPQIDHVGNLELFELYKNNISEYEDRIKKHCEMFATKI